MLIVQNQKGLGNFLTGLQRAKQKPTVCLDTYVCKLLYKR